jgi:Domain of unknown function (DUF4166)/Saccharopine dehydrogenase NADP binding domain
MYCLGIGPSVIILIIGGYGTFGGRIAELLSDTEALTLFIAGRSETKAIEFIGRLASGARKVPLAFERNTDVEKQIAAIKPDVVIDATGPFQNYGNDPYRVVKACIKQKAHYMDLADATEFVSGITQFDEVAKAKGVYILSGVSSFPVLTTAVVRRLSHGIAKLTDIKGGIAPSPYAGVGLNVIRAITAYAGKPIKIVRNGHSDVAYALTESLDYTIAPPGYLPLRKRNFSLFDVPDITVLPKLWPHLRSIWIGAGPVPTLFHRALQAFAWLVKLRLLPSLSLFAALFHFVSSHLRWGEHRGGMFLSVQGQQHNGESIERSWHLIAEGDDGPYIPSMAIEGIIRRSLAGVNPRAGARACTDDLELADYETLFKNKNIHTGIREHSAEKSKQPLYRQVLDARWHELSEPLRNLHERSSNMKMHGVACVQRGNSILSALLATLFRFPKAADNVPVSVSFRSSGNIEYWRRTFGEKSFFSSQTHGSTQGLISERFGPFAFDLALVIDSEKLLFVVRDWYFFGLRMPRFLKPSGNSYEFSKKGQFNFHVEIKHPLTGLIVRYSGWLMPSR